MHARELLDLAAILASHGRLLIRHPGPLAETGLEPYWTTSKCRLDRWAGSLKRFTSEGETHGGAWFSDHWPTVRATLEEILTGEVLTRVWTALVCAHDCYQQLDQGEPVARSVYLGHLEARHRALSLLVQQPIDAREAFRLNHLRRRADHWTDLLVGYLTRGNDASEFAAEPERARDFASDLTHDDELPNADRAWPMIRASLHAAFRGALSPASPNADLNAQIAGAILGCFPAELFHSTGVLRSLWSMRIAQTASDTQGMIDQLLALDGAPTRPPATPGFLALRRFKK